MKKLFLPLILAAVSIILLGAQSTVLTSSTVLTGTTKMGAVNISHSVTANWGQSGAAVGGASFSDTGNAGFPLAIPFTTPATASGNITVTSEGAWISSPTNAAWGMAIYTDISATGTVTTSAGALGGCTADCVQETSTANFNSAWAGSTVFITVSGTITPFVVASVQSSSILTLTTSPSTNTGVAFAAYMPGTLVANCNTFSGSTPPNPLASLVPSGCILSPSTNYWEVHNTQSNTEIQWGNVGNCANSAIPSAGVNPNSALGSFTSAASWPSTFPANQPNTNCSHAAFATGTYVSNQTYDIITAAVTACTSQLCLTNIPAVQSGDTLAQETVAGTSANPALSVTDATSGTTHDTLTKFGTCPGESGGFQLCFYYVCRATAGVNTTTSNYTVGGGGNHNTNFVLEISGTQSSCNDQSNYDTVYITTASWTSANSVTTGQKELLIGGALNAQLFTSPVKGLMWTGTSGWTALAQGQNPASGGEFISAVFDQIAPAGTYNLSGTVVTPTTTLPGIITLK